MYVKISINRNVNDRCKIKKVTSILITNSKQKKGRVIGKYNI